MNCDFKKKKLLVFFLFLSLTYACVDNSEYVYSWSKTLSLSDISYYGVGDPSLYYEFLETSGNVTYDSLIYENDGTFEGANDGTLTNSPTWNSTANMVDNYAITFDGVDDYVAVPHTTKFNGANLADGFSISVWITPNTVGEGGYGKIIDKSDGGVGTNGYVLSMNSATSLYFGLNDDYSLTGGAITLGEKNHVIVTVSSDAKTNFYINGIQSGGVNDQLTTSISDITSTEDFTIGNLATATTKTFDGAIDEVRFYNKVLTTDEISEIYNSGSGDSSAVRTKDLVGYWNFEYGNGTVAYDESSIVMEDCHDGNCRDFDGVDDLIYLDPDVMDDSNSTWTTSAWIKMSVNNGHLNNIMGDGQTEVAGSGFTYYVDSDDDIYVYVYDGNGDRQYAVMNDVIPDNTWTNIVFVKNETHLTMYKNGEIFTDADNPFEVDGYTADTTHYFVLGTYPNRNFGNWNTYWLEGELDNVLIFDYALTDTEIASLYENDTFLNYYDYLDFNFNPVLSDSTIDDLEEVDNLNSNLDLCEVPSTVLRTPNVTQQTINFDIKSIDSTNTYAVCTNSNETWQDTSCQYRIQIPITGSTTDHVLEPINITVNTTSTFTSDQIAFYYNTTNELIPWGNATMTSNQFQGFVFVNTTATENTTIFMYYGGLSCGDGAPTATNYLYEDFEDCTDLISRSGGAVDCTGGVMDLVIANSSHAIQKSDEQDTGYWTVIFKLDDAANNQALPLGLYVTNTGKYAYQAYGTGTSSTFALYDGSDAANVITSSWTPNTNVHVYKMSRDSSSNWQIWYDETSKGTGTDSTTTDFNRLEWAVFGIGTSKVYESQHWNVDHNIYQTPVSTYYNLDEETRGADQIGTIYVNLEDMVQENSYFNVSIRDENTNELWNFSLTQNETFTVECETSTSEVNLTEEGNNFYLIVDEDVTWFRIDVNDEDDNEYYRKQLPTVYYPDTEDISLYLIELVNTTREIVETTINLEDYTGNFVDPLIQITKNTEFGILKITSDLFDAEDKVIVYLENLKTYDLTVYNSDRTESRSFGFLVVDTAGDKTLTIADAEFASEINSTSQNIAIDYGCSVTNSTSGVLDFTFTDYFDTTTEINVAFLNLTSGAAINSFSVSSNNASFTQTITDTTTAYGVSFNTTNLVLEDVEGQYVIICGSSGTNSTIGYIVFDSSFSWTYKWLALILVVFTILVGGAADVGLTSIVVALEISFFKYANWLSETDFNNSALALIFIIAILANYNLKRRVSK